jgi:hypothetical protein
MDNNHKMFRHWAERVTTEDIELIQRCSIPRSQDKDELRMLFFPNPGELSATLPLLEKEEFKKPA